MIGEYEDEFYQGDSGMTSVMRDQGEFSWFAREGLYSQPITPERSQTPEMPRRIPSLVADAAEDYNPIRDPERGLPLVIKGQTFFPRAHAVTLKGFQIQPVLDILAMYPKLARSPFWIDQTRDTFLAVLYGVPSSLGVTVGSTYFGVSAWRPGLRTLFGLECVFESFQRLTLPMNGQQKNFLVAAVTVAQSVALTTTEGESFGSRNVQVAGSRMGLDSGMWHTYFEDYLVSYHPGSIVEYHDPYEAPSTSMPTEMRPITAIHRRSEFKKCKSTSILVDDIQRGGTHVSLNLKLPEIYSLKKEGEYAFGISEYRKFSHVVPAKFEESLQTCKCWSCKVLTYLADVYCGWPTFEFFRSRLARLGSVCESSTMLRLETDIHQARRDKLQGKRLSPDQAVLVPDLIPEKGPVADFVREKRGKVFAYLTEWENIVFSRAEPLDFLVVDSLRPLEEEGLPKVLLTKASLTLAGYREVRRIGDYRVLERSATLPKGSRKVKF